MRDYQVDTLAIRKLMIDNGIKSITALSELSQIGKNTLGGVLNRKIRPSANVMYALADCLHMDRETAGRIFFGQKLTD